MRQRLGGDDDADDDERRRLFSIAAQGVVY